jgi:hypothetical protein
MLARMHSSPVQVERLRMWLMNLHQPSFAPGLALKPMILPVEAPLAPARSAHKQSFRQLLTNCKTQQSSPIFSLFFFPDLVCSARCHR